MVKIEKVRQVKSAQEIYYMLKERFIKRNGWFIPGIHEKYLKIKPEK
jgi:hypothetical protein